MAEPQEDARPLAAATLPAELASITLGLAETPDGQRLAIQLTMLLNADQAKATVAKLADLTASMSSTGLVVATPSLRM